MHPKFMLLRLRVIVLSILLLIEISLVPAMQTGIYGQLLQQQQLPVISIKITSPSTGQQVPIGQLTISGRSTDNPTIDCTVYADWNNTKPFQKAIATGPGGVNDYSTWSFTYTDKYHLIINGTNNLTSKLSCFDNISSNANLTKNYSVNVIGVAANTRNNMTDGTISTEEGRQQPSESFTSDTNNITAISNETTTGVKQQGITAKDNVSSPTSIPVPLVANDFAYERVNVNITSHKSGEQVPIGNLTIAGYSSDNTTNDCTVYTNWNSQNPLQIAKALGPGGVNDYSTWRFTYTPAYHAITNGTNELTAQISCLDDDSNNKNNTTAAYLTNYYRVNVTGITEASSSSERTTSSEEQKEQTKDGSSSISIPTPSPLPSSPPTQKQQEEDKDVEKEEPESESEPQPEPEPEPKPEPQPQSEPETEPRPEDNDDTTIYWDIEDAEDSDKNNDQILDFEDDIFDLQ